MRLREIIAILLILVTTALSAQTGSEYIYMKDGKLLGKRSTLVKACVSGMGAKNGLNNKEQTCDCMMDVIARNFTMKDYVKLIGGEKSDFAKLFYDKKKPQLSSELLDCVSYALQDEKNEKYTKPVVPEDEAETDYIDRKDAVDITTSRTEGEEGEEVEAVESKSETSMYEQVFMETCKANLLKSPTLKGYDADVYCKCAYQKMFVEGNISEYYKKGNDKNSVVVNEVAMPCLVEASKKDKPATEPSATPGKFSNKDLVKKALPKKESIAESTDEVLQAPATVEEEFTNKDIKGPSTEKVKLINASGTYRLKVIIGTTTKYFMLDSGASEFTINSELEKELLEQGIITKADYLPEDIYTMANGKKVKARRVMISDIHVGGFTINNVEAVILSKDGSLLLGKSLLDKFSNWSIDNKAEMLILKK
jgi:clan AA aspartic protease (TIGR02281 family)